MTNGMNNKFDGRKPERAYWRFSMPMFVSVIFQQLYNITDSVIAGKLREEDALAAMGHPTRSRRFFMAIAVGSNIGCHSVLISQYFGARNGIK